MANSVSCGLVRAVVEPVESRFRFLTFFSAVALIFASVSLASAETWNLSTGGSWNSAPNWNPASVPNAIGARAIFNNAASGSNPGQTASSTVALDGSKTVGSINFNNDGVNSFSYTLSAGSAGPLVFDETNAGPATITVNSVSGSTGNNTISVATTLTDSLVATVNNVTASSTAGALNLTTAMSGPGGFTKQGDGLATFGTGAKTYAGPTVLNGGRMRISVAAAPTATASFTINAGAQMEVITASGTITFGTGPLNLNGYGTIAGPQAVFPGAIRNSTGVAITINNQVILQSSTLLHVQGAASGVLSFPNSVSGPGSLTLTATNSDFNQGQLILGGNNTYQGGTLVNGGTLVVSGSSATLGSGNVTVDHSASPSSTARLTIQSGVANAIADTATLSLAGGPAGMADLGAGVNEVVGRLVLAGAAQAPNTYGSSTSGAAIQNDSFFSGTGIITVVASVASPTLQIVSQPPNVVLIWPTNSIGFILEERSSLSPSNTWTTNTTPVVVSGTNNTVTVPATSPSTFYRLTN
jgi:autotransporter-associated beta strand protein